MRSNKAFNLICIPFAGGSIYSFKDFHSTSDDLIRIIPVELPGRGKRVNEHLLTNIHQIVDDLFIQIEDKLDEPYAIYGHSLGSLLGYLLVKLVLEKKRSPPVHLFCSGRGGPSLSMDDERLVDLPDKVFRDKLRELGGSPDEIFQNEEMIAFFEPILRADFRAHEDYEYIDTKPFDVPITVMVGREDRITLEDVELWQCETTCRISIEEFPGGHFFIFDHASKIVEIISDTLLSKDIKNGSSLLP